MESEENSERVHGHPHGTLARLFSFFRELWHGFITSYRVSYDAAIRGADFQTARKLGERAGKR